MKKLNYIGSFLAAMALLFTACEPIEDRLELKNSFESGKIELKVVQPSDGSNKLSLQMVTPGVTGYWDYVIDKAYTDRAEVIFPIPGKHTFTFHSTTGYFPGGDVSKVEYVTASIDVEITKLDYALPEHYVNLVGEELVSKTWVFDESNPDRWWYMTDESPDAFWWQPGRGDCTDADGEMIFDLDGGANYTYIAGPSSEPVKGSTWAFNAKGDKITIKGDANILGVMGGGESTTGSKQYEILELTENRMVLFQNPVVWSPGWVWVFKAK